MQSLYDIAAPAKLNLFLHIVGRRPDGYHLLQSVFVLIDWCDTLHFERRADGVISREDLTTPLPDDDLVLRAARILQQKTGCRYGAHIGIAKSIPAQAGMGGGSSDAASVLLALNRLWQLHLPLQQLMEWGLLLGADVPFFLQGRNAWVEGVGEQITPIHVPASQYLVVKPPQGLDTKLIFSDSSLKRDTKPATIAGFAADVNHFGCNDMQNVAVKLCAGVSQALEWLGQQGLSGRMTGSGSAVFARLDSQQPEALQRGPRFAGMVAKVCSSLEVHPLLDWSCNS
jgi:4-diphosphocytidyl-2-C-methyl-D-erythritol kinase